MAKDRLSMDVTDDLKRVDSVITRILQDRALWGDFVRDPNGVFVRLGLHPPTSPEINDRVNRIFYAILINKKLLKLVTDHFKKFRPSKPKRFADYVKAGLKKSVVQHPIEYDLEAVHHLLRSPRTLRQVLRLALHDLNNKGILQNRHNRKEIKDYIDAVVAAVRDRRSIKDHPKLEVWDRNYGVGRSFGFALIEVGVVATQVAIAETGGVATALAVAVNTAVAYTEVEVIGGPCTALARGDSETIRALAILGRLMDLAGELVAHAQSFERELRT